MTPDGAKDEQVRGALVPVLMGDGVRLFSVTGSPPVKLRKTRRDCAGQITDLSFEVLR